MTFKFSDLMNTVEVEGETYILYADHLDLMRRFHSASREISQLVKQLQKSEALEAVAKLQDAAVAQLYADRWPFAAADGAQQKLKDEYIIMAKAAEIIAEQILQSTPQYARDALEQTEKQKIEEGITQGLKLAVSLILKSDLNISGVRGDAAEALDQILDTLYDEINLRND